MLYYLGPPRPEDIDAIYRVERRGGQEDVWTRDQVELMVLECSRAVPPEIPPLPQNKEEEGKGTADTVLALVAYESDLEASRESKVVGYVVWYDEPKHSMLLSLVVDRDVRRKGLGRMLLEAVEDIIQCRMRPEQQKRKVYANVRESDLQTQLFLKACRWRCKGIRPRTYESPPEDAYVFRKVLTRCGEDKALKFYGMESRNPTDDVKARGG